MSAVFVTDAPAGTPDWHTARSAGLGGSEIAAVLGLSPFESRFGLWHRKHGDLGPVDETPEMYWGKTLEPVIRAEFERRADWYVRPTPGMYRHPERPWMIANPDAFLYEDLGLTDLDQPDAILECKLSMFGDGWGEDGTDQVPPHVRCQALWYLDVFDVETAWVVVFIASGLEIRIYEVTYDAEEAAELRQAAAEFLDHVDLHIRPDIDEHAATYEAVREFHPEIDGTETEIPAAVADLYRQAKTAEKAAKADARKATAQVADHMGQAARALCDGEVIARRQARDGGHPYVVAARGLTNGDDDPAETWIDPYTGETF